MPQRQMLARGGGQLAENAAENVGRRHRLLGRERVGSGGGCVGNGGDDDLDELTGEGGAALDAPVPVEGCEGALDHAGEVEGEAIGGFRFVKRCAVGLEARVEDGEMLGEGLGDQDFRRGRGRERALGRL